MAKFIYSTVVTAMLVGTYFLALWVFDIPVSDELKGLGVALWLLAYHYAGVEFQLLEITHPIKPKTEDTDPPEGAILP